MLALGRPHDLNADRSVSVPPRRAAMQWEPLHHQDRDPCLEPFAREDSHWLHHLDALLCADGANSQLIELDRAKELERSRFDQCILDDFQPPLSARERALLPPGPHSTYSSIMSTFPQSHQFHRLRQTRRAVDLEECGSPVSPHMAARLVNKTLSKGHAPSGSPGKRAYCWADNDRSMKVVAHQHVQLKMSAGRKRMATEAGQAPHAKYARNSRRHVVQSDGNSDVYAEDEVRTSQHAHAKPIPVMVTTTQPSTIGVLGAIRTSSGPGDGCQTTKCAPSISNAAGSSNNNDAQLLKARDAWEQLIVSLPVTRTRKAWLPDPDLFFSAVDQGIFRDTGRQLEQEYVVCRAEQAAGGGRELCNEFVSKLRRVGSSYLMHLTSPPTPTATHAVQAIQMQHARAWQHADAAIAGGACALGSATPILAQEEPSRLDSVSASPVLDEDDTAEESSTLPLINCTWPELEEAFFDALIG